MSNSHPGIHRADLLLVTVTEVEADAVMDAFHKETGAPCTLVPISGRNYYDLGMVSGIHVYMALSALGAGGLSGSQQTVHKGLEALSPAAVIMVGIAFGLRPDKQSIGTVLVSQQVHGYDLKWVGATQKVHLGDKAAASPRLLNWLRSANLLIRNKGERAMMGLILSGSDVLARTDLRKELQEAEPDAIGGEMELYGMYVACHEHGTDWIMIKAVCDWADDAKDENREANQTLAAKNAAGFLMHALRGAPLPLGEINTARSHQSGTVHPDSGKMERHPSDAERGALLALCDRNSIVPGIRGHLAAGNTNGILCLADYYHNRPNLQVARVHLELKGLQDFAGVKSVKKDYDRPLNTAKQFNELMCELLGVKTGLELHDSLRQDKSGLWLSWHFIDCAKWTVAEMKMLMHQAMLWLNSLPAPSGRVILVLLFRFDTASWFQRVKAMIFKKAGTIECLKKAFKHARRDEFRPIVIGELQVLNDYERDEFLAWLEVPEVRKHFPVDRVHDEIDQHFPLGHTRKLTEISKIMRTFQNEPQDGSIV